MLRGRLFPLKEEVFTSFYLKFSSKVINKLEALTSHNLTEIASWFQYNYI